jgi:UDP-N-acetylglucosamine--N-acetylmuramyl-(pentapeptide) pyrophosphoryl-undecaprenol N-acetylglucosamine transferase
LIPFPYSANNHQLYNAKFFHSKESAQIVEQNQLNTGLLEKKVKEIINDNKIIDAMKDKIKKIAKPNAAEIIASEILKVC